MEEKEEKKAKKKKHGWHSPFGVRIRKALCMLAFFCFMAGFYYYIVSVTEFGYDIFKKSNFFKTSACQDALESDIRTILYNAECLKKYENEVKDFSIYDVEEGMLYRYSSAALNSDFFSDNQKLVKLSSLNKWLIEKKILSYDMMWDLESVKNFLKSKDADRCYLYFSKKAFAQMFQEIGLQNENHRFLEELDEDAYIVFSDQDGYLQMQGYDPDDEDAADILQYDLSGVPYAAYDPKQDVYYSSWDDYFGPYGQYLYDCEYLKTIFTEDSLISYSATMNTNEDVEEFVNEGIDEDINGFMTENAEPGLFPANPESGGIIFALLRAENLNDSATLKDTVIRKKIAYEQAQEYFTNLQNSGFLYYLEKGSKLYKHKAVADAEGLTAQSDYAYVLEPKVEYGVRTGEIIFRSLDAAKSREGDIYNSYGEEDRYFASTADIENFVLYVGIDLRYGYSDMLQVFSKYSKWEQVSRYILPFTIAAGICLLLLIILAVSLLVSAGRKKKGDTEISLTRVDRLPFELWLFLFGIFIVGFTCMDSMIVYGHRSSKFGKTPEFALFFGVTCIPFGIAFMEFCLSLARRIKAKNLFQNVLILRLLRRGNREKKQTNKVSQAFYKARLSITEAYINCRFKLILWFALFVVLESFPISIMVGAAGDDDIFVFGLIIAFSIALVAGWLLYNVEKSIAALSNAVDEITKGNLDTKCEISDTLWLFTDLDDGINHIGDGLKTAVETSLKDERMKTELITNVSHDLKTPLTSIINYIDLLKKEEIPGEDAKHYIEVLEAKAQRLKHLTEDLVEAAKATSGNLELEMMPLTFDELMKQALGEFEDKYETRKLSVVASYPEEPAVILADGRRLYRVIENVLQNAYKYAMEGTRIYAELVNEGGSITFILKNVSAAPLNISPEELMERFTRGDSSRTTEGSGLGLSIAKDLTKLMGGDFEIQLDGDLFKTIIRFSEYRKGELE